MFLDLATNFSCHGVIATKEITLDTLIIQTNQSANSTVQCMDNLSAGVYQLMVYDVDESGAISSVPAFVFDNITIIPVTITPVTISSLPVSDYTSETFAGVGKSILKVVSFN